MLKKYCADIVKALVTVIAFFIISCNKNKLDIKPNKALVVPTTVQDFQALMDNNGVMNTVPFLGEAGADNHYLLFTRWNAISTLEKNAHVWEKEVFPAGETVNDWDLRYQQVFYANVALDGLNKLTEEYGTPEFNNVKGSALFFRGHAFYQLAQLFCKPFDATSADSDLGIPIRLSPVIDVPSARPSVLATYNQIISDLQTARDLLPAGSQYKLRPTKVATDALLARVYLSMRNYEKAFEYADLALTANNTLLDYNSLNPGASTPVPLYNNEVLFHATLGGSSTFNLPSNFIIDTVLFNSYVSDDLRKTIFFTVSSGLPQFKGSYAHSTITKFAGIANDEIYLIRAECYARKEMITEAMADLNTLLVNRWKTGTYISFTANSAQEALNIILAERRKELIIRGLRWTDLRRFNLEGANIALTRVLNGENYILPPNSPLYVYPIPPLEMAQNPMPQNLR